MWNFKYFEIPFEEFEKLSGYLTPFWAAFARFGDF